MSICIYVIQQNKTIIIYSVIMLSDAILIVMLNVIMLSAVMLSVVAPLTYVDKMPQKRVL